MLLKDQNYEEGISRAMRAAKVFGWIKEKLAVLEERAALSVVDRNTFEQFKREVQQNIKRVVVLSPKDAVTLIEEKFGAAHKEVIDLLARDPQEQMLYLETLLEE